MAAQMTAGLPLSRSVVVGREREREREVDESERVSEQVSKSVRPSVPVRKLVQHFFFRSFWGKGRSET